MKRIPIILFLAVCISVFSVTVQAADVEETKEKLIAFDLIEKNFDTGDTLTRAGFSDIMARFFPEDTYDYGKNQVFSDVPKDYPSAKSINKTAFYGVLNGVGGGKFEPDEEIGRDEMQIALVKLLGYSVKAERNGGYPVGYTSTAGELGLASGIPHGATSAEAALVMIDNALDVYIAENDLSGTSISISKEKKLMNHALNIYKTTGILNGAGMKAIDEKYQQDSDSVTVGKLRMDAPANKMRQYAQLVGRYVDAYYYVEDDTSYIVWQKVRKTTEKTVKLSDIVNIGKNTVTYKENDRKKTLKLEEQPYVIYNNRPVTAIPAYGDNGTATFLDTGDGYNFVEIKDYHTYVVENASESANSITTKLPASALKLDDYDYVGIADKDMTELSLKKIADNDILSVLIDTEKSCIEIIKSSDAVSGAVENIDFVEKEITIGGTVYPITSDFAKKLEIYSLSSLYSYDGEFKLDAVGNIAYFDMQIDYGNRVGYLIKMLIYDTDEDTRPVVRIMTDTGDIKEYRMKVKRDMIKIDGESTTAEEFKKNNTSNSGTFNGMVISYSLNDEGEVREIVPATQIARNGLHLFANVSEARYRRATLSFYNNAMLKSDAVIFHIPKEEKYKDDYRCYALMNTGSFTDGGKYKNIKLYALEKDAIAADVAVCEWDIEGDSANAYPMMIKKISTGLNVDDEQVDMLTGEMYSGLAGAESLVGSTLRKTDTSVKGTIPETKVDKGDIVVCNTNFFGESPKVKLIYDCSEDQYYQDIPYMLNDYQLTYVLGTVERRDGNMIKVKLQNSSNYEYYRVDTKKIFTVNDASSGDVQIEEGTVSDIRTTLSYGADASKVFIHASYNQPVFVVIYNN